MSHLQITIIIFSNLRNFIKCMQFCYSVTNSKGPLSRLFTFFSTYVHCLQHIMPQSPVTSIPNLQFHILYQGDHHAVFGLPSSDCGLEARSCRKLREGKPHLTCPFSQRSQACTAFFVLFFFNVYLFLRERQSMSWEGAGREETQNLKQASGSELSSQSLTWGSNPWTMRSWPEVKSRVRCLTDWATQERQKHHIWKRRWLLRAPESLYHLWDFLNQPQWGDGFQGLRWIE